ncbi:MAG: hypothetical protein OCD02_23390 [Spirochaetaceae bacterium]
MKIILTIILSFLIFSCSSNHKIHINKDNSAKVEFSVQNKQSLVETLSEMAVIQNSQDLSIIDVDQMKKDLEKEDSINSVYITSNNKDTYNGQFKVDNINDLFNDTTKAIPKELQIFTLSENNGLKTLKIQISLANYKYLKKTLPMLQDSTIDMIGPDSNQDLTKEEYLDMTSFTLGDNGPSDIITSFVDVKISVDGSILDIEGGEIIKSNLAAFNIPLIDLILLQKTYTYSLTYK